jgi:hypothetical protein
MKLQKMLLLKLFIFFMTLVLCHPGLSQVKKAGIISFTGVIDSIPQDSEFIVTNERRVFISPNTIITGERGGTLTVDDLRIRLHVTIEGVQKSDGIHAKKITVMKTPQKRP